MKANDKASLFARLEKLLALESRPGTLSEGIAATERINKLLKEHNLTRSQLHALGQDESDVTQSVFTADDLGIDKAGRRAKWQETLVLYIAKMLYCRIVFLSLSDQKRYGYNSFIVIGGEANIAMTVALFAALYHTAEAGAAKQEGKADKNAFRLGFAYGIADRVKKIVDEREAKVAEGDTEAINALMIVNKDETEIAKRHAALNVRQMSNTVECGGSLEAFSAGKQAGQRASLATNQLNTKEVKQVL